MPSARDALTHLQKLHGRFVDWLMPWSNGEGNTLERHRVSLLVGSVYQELFWAPVFAGLYWVLGPYWILQAGLLAIAVLALPGLLFIRRGALRAAENWITLNVLWGLTYLSFFTGGITSPALLWMVAVPLITSAFSDRRFAVVWSTLSIFIVVLMYGVEHFDIYSFPSVLSPAQSSLVTAAAIVGLAALLMQIRAQHQHLQSWLTEQIRNEQRELAAVLTAAPHAVLALDGEGRVEGCSKAAASTFGCSRDEVVGRLLSDFVPTLDARAFLGGSIEVESHVGRRAGALEFPLSLSMESYGTADNPRFVAIARDVTEELRREAELREAHKMEAVGRLAGGIAHDFNNLLSIISGHTQFLGAALGDDPQAREDLLAVEGATARAAFLVNEMLTFSRGAKPKPDGSAPLDLSAAARRAGAMLRRVLPEGIALEVATTAVSCRAVIHDTRLEQVILNIALNARDAMPAGGVLSLKTNSRASGCAADLTQWAVLEITDTGVGMEPHVLERIFEPFFTTKGVGQGSGFGLATAHGIVREAGGFIEVDSTPGIGTTFSLWLPLAPEEKADLSVAAARPIAPDAPASRIVLVIEDEPALRKIARRLFQARGFTVLEAADGEEAVELARAQAGDAQGIDLIFSDVVMPRMGGIEAVRLIRQAQPQVRTIFVSGFPRDAEDLPGQLRGDRFLAKPYTPVQLFDAVKSALEPEASVSRCLQHQKRDAATSIVSLLDAS